MTVYIHIGPTKTGTTSIQVALASNRRRLRQERSLYFPRFAAKQWPIALLFVEPESLKPFQHYILRGRGTREDALSLAQTFSREFDRFAPRYRTQVVSAEQFPLLNRDGVRALRSYFTERGFVPKVVAYIRHPAERLSSLLSQQLLSGQANFRSFRPHDDTTPAIRTYAEVFGQENIILRRFGPQYFTGGDLFTDFMTAIGQLPLEGYFAPQLNESLSLPAAMIADRLFDVAPLVSGRRGTDRYLLRIAGPKFRAPRALVEAAVEAHREGLDYLGREFGIILDAVDLSAFPETFPSDFPAEAIVSIAEILNEQSRELGKRHPRGRWMKPLVWMVDQLQRLRHRVLRLLSNHRK